MIEIMDNAAVLVWEEEEDMRRPLLWSGTVRTASVMTFQSLSAHFCPDLSIRVVQSILDGVIFVVDAE